MDINCKYKLLKLISTEELRTYLGEFLKGKKVFLAKIKIYNQVYLIFVLIIFSFYTLAKIF